MTIINFINFLPFLKEVSVDFDSFAEAVVVLDVTVWSFDENNVGFDRVVNLVDISL